MIAINISDLTMLKQIGPFNMAGLLLKDFLSTSPPTSPAIGGRWDEVGVILDGPAAKDAERVESLVTLLQTIIGPKQIGRRIRCYRQGSQGGWSQIMPGKTNRQLCEDLEEENDNARS